MGALHNSSLGDVPPVWSISCLFVAKAYRRQGISVKLIEAAVKFAAQRGARVVEAYPVTPYAETMPPVFAWTAGRTAAQAPQKTPKTPKATCVTAALGRIAVGRELYDFAGPHRTRV